VKQNSGRRNTGEPVSPMNQEDQVEVTIYVAQHCHTCDYSYQVAEDIQRDFPDVNVRIIDLEHTTEMVPEAVFATPTYLLNGLVWSLGNPSPAKVEETLGRATRRRSCG
jgi:predicted thioredoxin/glutaredoxin